MFPFARRDALGRPLVLSIALTGVAAPALLAIPAQVAEAAPPPPAVAPDFNGDGTPDQAVSGDNVVVVSYGNPATFEVLRGSSGSCFEGLAPGDFDDDGYDDLAVGDSCRGSGSMDFAGAVWVYRGSAHGLLSDAGTADRTEIDQRKLPGTRQGNDALGNHIAAGDVTGDGVDDLAVGAVRDKVGTRSSGSVTLIPGSDTGPASGSARRFSQNTLGVAGADENGDGIGATVVIGDVTGDGRNDLVFSAYGENHVGAVHVLRGGAGMPTGTGSSLVDGSKLSLTPSSLESLGFDRSDQQAWLGWHLTIGDVTGDGRNDVVAGAPTAKVSGKQGCGAIVVLRTTASGIATSRAQVRTPSTANVVGACHKAAFWGQQVAVGDLTGDGRAEVVVSAGKTAVNGRSMAGGYVVLRPSGNGVTGEGSFLVTQDTANVPGVAEKEDFFGGSLAVRDLNGDGRQDVVAGATGERVDGNDVGYAAFLLSSTTGRPAAGSTSVDGTDFRDDAGAVPYFGHAFGLTTGRVAAPTPAPTPAPETATP